MNKKIIVSFILSILVVVVLVIALLIFKAVKYVSSTPPEDILKSAAKKVEKMTKDWIDYTRPDIDEYFKRYNNKEFDYICNDLIRQDKSDRPDCIEWMKYTMEKYGKVSSYEIYKSKIGKHIDFDMLETEYTVKVPVVYDIKGEAKTEFKLLESKFEKLKIESIEIDNDDK